MCIPCYSVCNPTLTLMNALRNIFLALSVAQFIDQRGSSFFFISVRRLDLCVLKIMGNGVMMFPQKTAELECLVFPEIDIEGRGVGGVNLKKLHYRFIFLLFCEIELFFERKFKW